MAQAKQTIFVTPNNDWCCVDNSAAPTFPTFNANTQLGYDTTAPGTLSQATNPFGDTGTVLLDDSGNDTTYVDPGVSTVVGNPVSNITPAGTSKLVTKVLTNSLSATIRWKNPA